MNRNRYSRYDEDAYRLPEGMTRVGYDADEQKYIFRDRSGNEWASRSGEAYGKLERIGWDGGRLLKTSPTFSSGKAPATDFSEILGADDDKVRCHERRLFLLSFCCFGRFVSEIFLGLLSHSCHFVRRVRCQGCVSSLASIVSPAPLTCPTFPAHGTTSYLRCNKRLRNGSLVLGTWVVFDTWISRHVIPLPLLPLRPATPRRSAASTPSFSFLQSSPCAPR
ncbi:hypothetical protein IWX49DRAFT_308219 [Phyllosticta citricarpa]